MEKEGWWRLICLFFYAVIGGCCQLRSGRKGRLFGPGLCFFYLLPTAVVCGCGWWGNSGSGCCCCVVMVWFFFFFFPLLLRFLDLEFVGVVAVDVAVVVDDNGEEIIYYFNV